MLSLALTLIVILGLVGVVSYSLRAQAKTARSHNASVLAASLMEDAQASSWEDFDAPLDAPRQAVYGQPGYEFARAEEVENPDLKRVLISVYWVDQNGARQYDLWTKLVREQ